MPGSSLWLIPPLSHPLHSSISQLITDIIPSRFPDHAGPAFAAHMTLTSNIDPAAYGSDPQAWLDAIPWPKGPEIKIRLLRLKSEDVFFRRCYIQVAYDDSVRDLVGLARARGVLGEDGPGGEKTVQWLEEWRKAFGPHVSLIYGDKIIDEHKLNELTKVTQDAGVRLDDVESNQEKAAGSWEGGMVWLVPTDKPIAEWKPIATKVL